MTAKKNGAAINLTGGTLRMMAKYSTYDDDASAVFNLSSPSSGIVVTDAPNGKATVTISPANTVSLPEHRVDLAYEIRLTESGGAVDSLTFGTLTVLPNVVNTTP